MKLRFENAEKTKLKLKGKIHSYNNLANILLTLLIVGFASLIMSIFGYFPKN